MRRLFFSLLLLVACDPDLTPAAKPGADAASPDGSTVDSGPGPVGPDSGSSGEGGADGGEVPEDGGVASHTIDGDNDFKPGEKLITSSTAVNPYEAFVAWDDKRIYLGMSGPDIGSGSGSGDRWLLVYIGGGTGTTAGLEYGGVQRPNLPFSAGFHVRWKADGQYTNGQRWDGQAWVDAAGVGLVPVAMRKGTFVEMSINRSAVGNPTTLELHMSMIKENGGDWTYAGVPSTSFTDGVDPDYAKYFAFDLADTSKAPKDYTPKP